MKNLKVEALIIFEDKLEKIKRNVGDTFEVTKERYEFLASKNAVKLIEDIVTEEEVQAVANAIAEEAIEQDKTIEEVVNEIVEESNEEVEEKPKKKARRK